MKISNVIQILQQILEARGDLDLVTSSHCDPSLYEPAVRLINTVGEGETREESESESEQFAVLVE